MLVAALFTVARTWKQPKCSQTKKWIKKWYKYTMQYYLSIEGGEMMWVNLEHAIQSEVNHKEKNKHHILMHECEI